MHGSSEAALSVEAKTVNWTWRPRWYAWALVGIAMLAIVAKAKPSRLTGHWLVITPLLLVAVLLIVRRLWELHPAIPMCGALVLTIFSGGWSRMGLGGFPVDRVLLIIAVAAFFLRAPGVARLPRVKLKNIHFLLVLTLLYVLTSAAVSGTLTSEVSLLGLFDRIGIIPYMLFLLAPAIFSGKRERAWLLGGFIAVGLYLGLTAIFESLGPHALVFPHYILTADSELQGERAAGPFQSTVSEGSATFGCAVAAVMAFREWHRRPWRYLAIFVGVICGFACFLTLERGVWIAAVAAASAAALATRKGRRLLLPALLSCALVIGGALLVSPKLAAKTSTRVTRKVSVWDRQNQTLAGLRMVEAKPLLGFGWSRYTSDSSEYFRQAAGYPLVGSSTPSLPRPLHDSYLSYAVELGLLGTALWFGTLLWAVVGAIVAPGPPELHPWKVGLIAIAVFFLVVGFFDPYQAAYPVLVLWMWAGVALGSSPGNAKQAPMTIDRRRLAYAST
jgi:putative inorganic carbon (hco3(-)) transporter